MAELTGRLVSNINDVFVCDVMQNRLKKIVTVKKIGSWPDSNPLNVQYTAIKDTCR